VTASQHSTFPEQLIYREPQFGPKLESFEDELLPRKPSQSPAAVLKFWLFLYGIFAVGYAVFRIAVRSITWAVSHLGWTPSLHFVFGLVGVFGLLCIGPCLLWLYASQRRLFGCLELLASIMGAFYYSSKALSAGLELGVVVSLPGVAFLFVKGINDMKSIQPQNASNVTRP
jgi:hypothetical protein